MTEQQIIERLLQTNEKISQSSDRKFNFLAILYVLTVVGFFSYLSLGMDSGHIDLSTTSTFESEIEQKVGK